MAKTVRIDHYVTDVLMRDLVGHDKSPSAFLVYLLLWRESGGNLRRGVTISHQRMAEEIGLSKSAVQAAVRRLKERRLIRALRPSITAVPEYFVLKPWAKR